MLEKSTATVSLKTPEEKPTTTTSPVLPGEQDLANNKSQEGQPRSHLTATEKSKFSGFYPLNFSVTKMPRHPDTKSDELDPEGKKFWWIVESDEPTIDVNEFKTKTRDYLPLVFNEDVDLSVFDTNQNIESQQIKDRLKRRNKIVQTTRQNIPKLTLRLDGELDISKISEPAEIPDDIFHEIPTDFTQIYEPFKLDDRENIAQKIHQSASSLFEAVLGIQENTPEIPMREIPPHIMDKASTPEPIQQAYLHKFVTTMRKHLINILAKSSSALYHLKPKTFPETKSYPIFYKNTRSETQEGNPAATVEAPKATNTNPQPSNSLVFESMPLPMLPIENILQIPTSSKDKFTFDNFNKHTGLDPKDMILSDELIELDEGLTQQQALQYIRDTRKKRFESQERIQSAKLVYLQTLRNKRQLTSLERQEWLELMRKNSEDTSKNFLKKRKP